MADGRWAIATYVQHPLLPSVCESWERRGYEIVAVLPAGVSAQGAVASVLVRLTSRDYGPTKEA